MSKHGRFIRCAGEGCRAQLPVNRENLAARKRGGPKCARCKRAEGREARKRAEERALARKASR